MSVGARRHDFDQVGKCDEENVQKMENGANPVGLSARPQT
jgi:hypothetical protein